tara:strand:- start:2714 stop:4111 length:1398 start_codon:yes stop_codon:yes gene_type:complete
MAPLRLIHVPDTTTVTRVDVPANVPFTDCEVPVVVTGEAGTEYVINFDKKESLTSNVTKEVTVTPELTFDLPNYNFTTNEFDIFKGSVGASVIARSNREKQIVNAFALDSKGTRTHLVAIDETSTSRRFDITLEPVTKKGVISKLGANAPSKAGVVSVIQRGLNTLTITPTTYDNTSNFATLPSSLVISKPERFENDPYNIVGTTGLSVRGTTSGVSSTRLVVEADTETLTVGMLVAGKGVPHNTTISSINPGAVILNTASTVADSTVIRFETVSPDITPFSFTISPAQGKTLSVIDYDQNDAFNRPLIIGGLGGNLRLRQHNDVDNSTTLNLIAAVEPVITGQGLFSAMSRLPGTPGLHGSRNIMPGMNVVDADENAIVDANGNAVTVASITDHDTIVLSSAITKTTASGEIGFQAINPRVSSFGLNVNKVGNDIIVSGYVKTNTIDTTGIVPVHLDSIIESHN